MVTLGSLWLPILISAVVVFVLGFLMWMVSPHHRSDWAKLPDEEGVMAALREKGVGPGQYTMPHAPDPAAWKDPELIRRYQEGPSGFITIRPAGGGSMGKNLAICFAYDLIISIFLAYLASFLLTSGSSGGTVFRLVGTAGFLAYSGALPSGAIWFSRSWASTLKEMFDGLLYGLATAGVFVMMWPSEAAPI